MLAPTLLLVILSMTMNAPVVGLILYVS